MEEAAVLHELLRMGTIWSATKAEVPELYAKSSLSEQELPGTFLKFGAIHEVCFSHPPMLSRSEWFPPVLATWLLLQQSLKTRTSLRPPTFAWIGRRCWPFPASVNHQGYFIDPHDKEERLWTISKALSCPGLDCTIADGSGLSAKACRRLQLAARTGQTLGILLRPAWEARQSSSAQTQWLIAPEPSEQDSFLWSLTLAKAPGLVSARTWLLEHRNVPYGADFRALSTALVVLNDVKFGTR